MYTMFNIVYFLFKGRKWNTNFIPNSLMVESAFDVQLYGGFYPHEGRIGFQHKNQWGVICEDTWDLRDADVICRQLGFEKGASNLAAGLEVVDRDGRRQPTVIMTDIECSGNELTIDECKFNLVKPGKCLHSAVNAGVFCVPGMSMSYFEVPLLKMHLKKIRLA